ncbi:MAG: hypothetical protein HW410_1784 [Nitrosarchaeum sp.]|nr:hypothetical protein [Nitrosarchaeum sp.]
MMFLKEFSIQSWKNRKNRIFSIKYIKNCKNSLMSKIELAQYPYMSTDGGKLDGSWNR